MSNNARKIGSEFQSQKGQEVVDAEVISDLQAEVADLREKVGAAPPPSPERKQTFLQKNWTEASTGRKVVTVVVATTLVAGATYAGVRGVRAYRARNTALPPVDVGM